MQHLQKLIIGVLILFYFRPPILILRILYEFMTLFAEILGRFKILFSYFYDILGHNLRFSLVSSNITEFLANQEYGFP